MRINAFELIVTTANGDFGFACEFKRGLNIIRGNNSSGKSTLLNSIFYALGMEELLGGRGPKVLPYSVKDYVPEGDENQAVLNSYVRLEIENQRGQVSTLQRAIKSPDKDSKLIEITDGPCLTGQVRGVPARPTFIHDPGAAQDADVGYFRVLEQFLGFSLPLVPGTSGNEVKLYLQTLFAAILIEQKRGWTDYIANIPYFGIRDGKRKVVEYLLALDVFENDRKRNALNSEFAELGQRWESERYKIELIENRHGLSVLGIPKKPPMQFDSEMVGVKKLLGEEEPPLEEYVGLLVTKIEALEARQKGGYLDAPVTLVQRMEEAIEELARLNSLHESLASEVQINKSLRNEYQMTQESLFDDLTKNKTAKKLRNL